MKVIFLTISRIQNIEERGIYTDLMRAFRDKGHEVCIVYPHERKFGLPTSLKKMDGIHLLGVKTLNIQKTNKVEKGIGTILLETQFKLAIQKHLSEISFDLILYSTPPITLTSVVRYLKSKNPKALSYLLLKDIFPQNAVDIGMFSKKSLFYQYFRKKEEKLYKASDYIGCMSPANVGYVLRHNPSIDKKTVEVAPNSIELTEEESIDKEVIRRKYNLPVEKPIFIYGGNLGKPQGVGFLIQCLEANKDRQDCFFLIVGNGTEYNKLASWFIKIKPDNAALFARLPKDDYDSLVRSCDVGLIFLDYRFTIPNYPSRLLSYLEYKMPIIAATDVNTDIGTIAEQNGYGYRCESNDVNAFTVCVNKMVGDKEKMKLMGEKGYQFLLKNYLVENTYQQIVKHLK